MLSEYPIDVMLLATDLDVVRDFYGRKLGLEILLDNDQFVTGLQSPSTSAASPNLEKS